MRRNLPKFVVCAICCSVLALHCSSTTLISSEPSGATLYVDTAPVGKTPYQLTDTKIVGARTYVRMNKPGCKELNTIIVKDERFQAKACAGGVFLWFPFLWILGYNPVHHYRLECGGTKGNAPSL